MQTDYMVIGRTRNADNIQRLVDGIKAKGYSCYNFFALNKKLILIGEVEKPETLYLMFKERYKDIESFLNSI